MKYDVLCIGSATVDHFITINEDIKSLREGQKILIKNTQIHSGGGATNAACALSKLNIKTRVLTKIGNDHNSEYIKKELKEFNVKNICQEKSKKQTDFSFILSSKKSIDRIIFVHKGASKDLSYKKINSQPKWIYLSSLIGKSLETGIKIAKNSKSNILFNPSSYVAKLGKTKLKSILNKTQILVLNKEEAQYLLKKKTSSINLLKDLQRLGPKVVIITNGNKTLYAINNNLTYSLTPPKVKIVHTAGAGDSFTAGFLAGIIKNYKFEDCLKLGQVNSSSVIQAIGTKIGLLNLSQAKKQMKKIKIKCLQTQKLC